MSLFTREEVLIGAEMAKGGICPWKLALAVHDHIRRKHGSDELEAFLMRRARMESERNSRSQHVRRVRR